MGGGGGMVKVGETKKSRDDVDSGPMKEEKRWIFPPLTNFVSYVPYQTKEEIVNCKSLFVLV